MNTLESPEFVHVILLCWRNPGDVLHLVDQIRAEYPAINIIIVDNESTTESWACLNAIDADQNACRLRCSENRGYGAAHNLAFDHVRQTVGLENSFFYLLNSDALPEPGAITSAVRALQYDPALGAVGSVLYREPAGSVESAGMLLQPLLARSVPFKRPPANRTVAHGFYVTFAGVALRGKAVDDVGGFDERFFMYWEDADMCMRFRKCGWRIEICPLSKVRHKSGESRRYSTSLRILTYQLWSVLEYAEKYGIVWRATSWAKVLLFCYWPIRSRKWAERGTAAKHALGAYRERRRAGCSPAFTQLTYLDSSN